MKRKQKEYRRLPDGKTTTSVPRYIREWRRFAKPLEQALGGRAYAYDPGVCISVGRSSVSFDSWVVKKLNAALATTVTPEEGK